MEIQALEQVLNLRKERPCFRGATEADSPSNMDNPVTIKSLSPMSVKKVTPKHQHQSRLFITSTKRSHQKEPTLLVVNQSSRLTDR